MYAVFTLARYPLLFSIAGFFSMALFRIPLGRNRKISFYKLMGCGRGGTFSKLPGFTRWAIFMVTDNMPANLLSEKDPFKLHYFLFGRFIAWWYRFFNCESTTIILQPLSGHGMWDGNGIFRYDMQGYDPVEEIAVLTRATLRIKKVNRFFKHVGQVSDAMSAANGYICSVSIGEVPWLKQGTFSFWKNEESMKDYAYNSPAHVEVIRKTRKEEWYKEEMFVRFKIINKVGEWV